MFKGLLGSMGRTCHKDQRGSFPAEEEIVWKKPKTGTKGSCNRRSIFDIYLVVFYVQLSATKYSAYWQVRNWPFSAPPVQIRLKNVYSASLLEHFWGAYGCLNWRVMYRTRNLRLSIAHKTLHISRQLESTFCSHVPRTILF